MKKLITLIFAGIFILCSFSVSAANNDIKVNVNNSPVTYDSPPVIVNDRTMVPIRQTAEALGANVKWDDSTKTATVTLSNRVVKLTQDNPYIYINDIRLLMDAPTTNINSRIHIPVRHLAEALDAAVLWDKNFRTVEVITDRQYIQIDGKYVVLGDPISIAEHQFGKPSRIDKGIDRFDWYVYNSDYSKFMMLGVLDGKIISIYTAFSDFILNGKIKYGDKLTSNAESTAYTLYSDSLDDFKIYGVWIGERYSTSEVLKNDFFNARVLTEKQLIDVINAFRQRNNLSILSEDIIATYTCRKHSQDMADNNYFNHINLSEQSPWDRYDSAGGKYYACTENIAAESYTCQDIFDTWLNLEAERENLSHTQATFIGCGIGYSHNSDHQFYTTKMFSYIK